MQREQELLDEAWASASGAAAQPELGLAAEYAFREGNPYDGDAAAMQKALEAFHRGSLTDACLALEAVVKAEPSARCPAPRRA